MLVKGWIRRDSRVKTLRTGTVAVALKTRGIHEAHDAFVFSDLIL